MSDEQLRSIYREVLLTTPYNSVSQHYEFLAHELPDPRFGATCCYQSVKVGTVLKSHGYRDVFYLRDHRHALAICQIGAESYLFDPYLLHTDPINLTEVADHPDGKAYSAYPFRVTTAGEVKPSRLRVRYDPKKKVVSEEYFRYSLSRGKYTLSRYFKMRLDQPVYELPPAADIVPLLFHPEQNNLSIRVVIPAEKAVTDLIYPICYHHGDPFISAARLIIRDNAGGIIPTTDRQRFSHELSRMAEAAGVLPGELTAFILRGVAIYEEHAPKQIPYAAFEDYKPLREEEHAHVA
jgi:hypothetical protein